MRMHAAKNNSTAQHRNYVGLLFNLFDDFVLMGGGMEGFTVKP